jgi:hypothetical protein
MDARLTTVSEDFGVIAACAFECIRQDGEAVESPILVNRAGQLDHFGRQPAGIGGDRPEGVAENVTQQFDLNCSFHSLCFSECLGPCYRRGDRNRLGGECPYPLRNLVSKLKRRGGVHEADKATDRFVNVEPAGIFQCPGV